MPAHVTYPGVYVLEESSGAQAVAAASTSTALFVGMVDRGPFGVPTRVLSQVEYERVFGATSSGEMADQVRQFYVNGGSEAWIMRIANNARAASITLENEDETASVIKLTARDLGAAGNLIRAEVDYDTASPDRTFNLTLYRSSLRTDGSFEKKEVEVFGNLSMDPGSARYAPNMVNNVSALAKLDDITPTTTIAGVSISGAVFVTASAAADLAAKITAATNSFRIAIANNPPVNVVLPAAANLAAIGAAIIAAYSAVGVTVAPTATLETLSGGKVLQIADTTGSVVITPAATADVTVALMLGVSAGGVEFDSTTPRRPAPTGVTSWAGPTTGAIGVGWLATIEAFGQAKLNDFASLTLTDPTGTPASYTVNPPIGSSATATIAATPAPPAPFAASLANIRKALDLTAEAIGLANPTRWSAKRTGLRIMIAPKFNGPASSLGSAVTSLPTYKTENGIFTIASAGKGASNVAAYSLGREGNLTPAGQKQTNVANDAGSNGTDPTLSDYQAAFGVIESELDSFNLLLLPRTETQTDLQRHGLWGVASALAAKRRAILLVDPDASWSTIANAESGVATLKIGVETRNAAVYWPRLVIPDATKPAGRTVDPSGSIAGLMARTDTRSGVWTAPAGLEASIRGIVGIGRNMSDDENGVLNPKALNAIRLFPSGVVAWGARTMVGSDDTGNIDDKYIPVRRTMLFIEESLYRGLKFAVFRPNAEPLWASIRLAAGSFMNGLMRQGAFASRNKLEAYYVLCDATTTTETDRNLGIVNVVVAFAPLKPAEFVVLTVKQIAGQGEI